MFDRFSASLRAKFLVSPLIGAERNADARRGGYFTMSDFKDPSLRRLIRSNSTMHLFAPVQGLAKPSMSEACSVRKADLRCFRSSVEYTAERFSSSLMISRSR